MILMLMEGPGDHETQPRSCLPVRAISVAVVDRTAGLLKSCVQRGTIKKVKRAAVLCEAPCCEVRGVPLPAPFSWELGWPYSS